MQSELATLVENLASRRVVVLGDLVADHYVFGQTDRVSREAPVLVVRYETSEVKLGGGANAAANVRSLGGQGRGPTSLGESGRRRGRDRSGGERREGSKFCRPCRERRGSGIRAAMGGRREGIQWLAPLGAPSTQTF